MSSPVSCPGRPTPSGRRCRDSGRRCRKRSVVNSERPRGPTSTRDRRDRGDDHRLGPGAVARHHADPQADGHDPGDAGRAAVAQRCLGHRADGAGGGHEQDRRRRLGDVLAVVRAGLRQHGQRAEPTRSTAWTSPGPAAKASSSAISTPTCSRKSISRPPAGNRRIGQGRIDHQHGHEDRHQPVHRVSTISPAAAASTVVRQPVGRTLADLLAAVPPRARAVNPNLVPSAQDAGDFRQFGVGRGADRAATSCGTP